MDSSFTIRPPAGARGVFAPRDPVRVHEAVETEFDATRAVTAPGNDTGKQQDPRGDQHDRHAQDHAPQDVVADPKSREVIYRERDVRADAGQHPDHALLRQRAYRPKPDTGAQPSDPHADIKA